MMSYKLQKYHKLICFIPFEIMAKIVEAHPYTFKEKQKETTKKITHKRARTSKTEYVGRLPMTRNLFRNTFKII